MLQIRYFLLCLMILLVLALSGCERHEVVCSSDEGTPPTPLQLSDLIQTPPPDSVSLEPLRILIGGREIEVDKLVDYPLCNDNWSGTVYVSCQARVAEAELDASSNPLFLKGCQLDIAPNTVVYVAAHNDAPYYKGCSCHTGTAPQP
jgi:hypothetical protein